MRIPLIILLLLLTSPRAGSQTEDVLDLQAFTPTLGFQVVAASKAALIDQPSPANEFTYNSNAVQLNLPIYTRFGIDEDGGRFRQVLVNSRLEKTNFLFPYSSREEVTFYRPTLGLSAIILPSPRSTYFVALATGYSEDARSRDEAQWWGGGLFLGEYQSTESLSWIYGAFAGRSTFGQGLLPLGGMRYRFENSWRLSVILPALVEADYWYTPKFNFGLVAALGSFNARYENQGEFVGEADHLNFASRHLRLGAKSSWGASTGLHLAAEIGRLVGRELSWRNDDRNILRVDVEPSGYMMLAANYKFPAARPAAENKSVAAKKSPVSGPLTSGEHELSLVIAGQERYFLVHIPPQYQASRKWPVVMAFHGGGGNMRDFVDSTGLSTIADRQGFIVIYPQGYPADTRAPKKLGTWNALECCGPALKAKTDDNALTRAILENVESRLSVDRTRIYATGFSNGAQLSLRFSCELADVFAAVAPVGASMPVKDICPRSKRKVPMLIVHGASDNCAKYNGGDCGGCFQDFLEKCLLAKRKTARDDIWQCSAVNDFSDRLAKQYGCNSSPQALPKQDLADCVEYQGCRTDLMRCTYDGVGHQWPGGSPEPFCRQGTSAYRPLLCKCWQGFTSGPKKASLNASELIWQFFSKHQLK